MAVELVSFKNFLYLVCGILNIVRYLWLCNLCILKVSVAISLHALHQGTHFHTTHFCMLCPIPLTSLYLHGPTPPFHNSCKRWHSYLSQLFALLLSLHAYLTLPWNTFTFSILSPHTFVTYTILSPPKTISHLSAVGKLTLQWYLVSHLYFFLLKPHHYSQHSLSEILC